MASLKMSKFLFLVFTIVLLIPNFANFVPNVSAIGGYTSTPPTIDGVIGDIEWQNAETVEIDFGEHDEFHYIGTLYVMNDIDNVYMAFEINDPVPGQARLTLLFDCGWPEDGIPEDGVRFIQITSQYSDLDADLNPDGHIDGVMASTVGADINYFELSKPMRSPDPDDSQLTYARVYVIYRSGSNVFESTDWQNFRESKPYSMAFDIRHPEKVSTSQNTFITLEVDFTILDPDLVYDAELEIMTDDHSVLDSAWIHFSESANATETFELTSPAAAETWSLTGNINYYHEGFNFASSGRSFQIEVVDDLEIDPENEGICIWDGPPPPETAPPSEQIEIPIEVKYAVTYDAWIVAGIYDEEGALVSTIEFDETVSGVGTNDYIFEVTTPGTEGPWNLKASLYYGHEDGVDAIHEECDEWPFTLTITSGVPGGEGVKIIDITNPVEVNSGDEIQVDVNVEYELPAGAKYRTSILDSTSSLIIKTSDEMTAASHGFETFSFDGIYSPFVLTDTTFTLLTVAEYKTDGDWQILDPEGQKEFQIKILGVQISPGELPVGPPIPPLPVPPDSLPPTPEDFDFTLTVTPDTQEATLGQTVSYEIEVQGSGEGTQLVTLGISGYPIGATSNIIPLAGTPTYSSTLNIIIGDSVQPGIYTIIVDAAGGEKTHSDSVSLIVKSPPDFSISLSTPEVTIEQGESTSVDINVEPLHGFNTPVNLAVTTSPNGVETKLNPESQTPAFTSKIEITVENNVDAGTYPLIITAEGSSQKNAQVILNVEAPRLTDTGEQPQFPYGMLALIVIILFIITAILAVRRRKAGVAPPPPSPMKFCIECGAQIPMDTLHCPKCGVKQQ
ncbi:hypothetical protein [[Eubacterium] cellulosolvens]